MLKIKQLNKLVILVLFFVIGVTILIYFMTNSKEHQTALLSNSANYNDPHLYYDESQELIWTRCHVGQYVENQACVQEAKMYTWQEAQKAIADLNQKKWLGSSDWRLPHIHELQQMVHCSTGYVDQTEIPGKSKEKLKIQHGCKLVQYIRPTIRPNYFLETHADWYWSADAYTVPNMPATNTVWGAYLSSGYIYDLQQETKGFIYAVRNIN